MNCLGAGLLALIACLGNPDPNIRDKVAFERLSAAMRGGEVDRDTLAAAKSQLLKLVVAPDPQGFQRPFAILTLAEVARTDRIKPWMTADDRDVMVNTASTYLSTLTDYRAFNDKEGFRHGVAHGADFALQLALNPAITKPQLDRLLAAIATQVAPRDPGVAYWAGEPDRLARAVMFIAQRKLHTDAEWKAWFESVMSPESARVLGCGVQLRDWDPQAPQRPRLPPQHLCDRDNERRRRHHATGCACSRFPEIGALGTVLARKRACQYAYVLFGPSGLFRFSF